MAVSQQVKREFRNMLLAEYGISLSQNEADKILMDLVGYYRKLGELLHKVEGPQNDQ